MHHFYQKKNRLSKYFDSRFFLVWFEKYLFLDPNYFQFKDQIGIRRNYISGTSFAVSQMRRYIQDGFISHIHLLQSFFKSRDHLCLGTVRNKHRFISYLVFSLLIEDSGIYGNFFNTGVKQGSICKITGIMYLYHIPIFWFCAI